MGDTPLSLERDIIPLLQLWRLNQLHGKVTIDFHGERPPRLTLQAEIHDMKDLRRHRSLHPAPFHGSPEGSAA